MPEAAQDYVDVSGIEKGAEKMPAMDSPAPTSPPPPPTKQPGMSELEYQKLQLGYWTRMAEAQNRQLEAAKAADKAQRDYEKAAAERRPQLQQALQQEQAAINQPLPQMPQAPPPSMAPPISKDTAMTMASIGMLIAGLGGFGSKSTGRAMINAATGMLDGFYKGRYDQAKEAHQQWEDFFKYQMGIYKMQIDQFNARMAQGQMTLENKIEQYKLDMAPFQDAQQRAEMAQKDYAQIFNENAKVLEAMSKMSEANDKVKYDWARLDEQHRHNLAVEAKGGPGALTPAQQEKRRAFQGQVTALESALDKAEAMLPDLEKKGFLPKSEGRGAYTKAELSRWMHPGDPALAAWNALQGAVVGIDRSVLNDMGPRAIQAYQGALGLFDKPFTKEGIKEAFKNFREFVNIAKQARLGDSASPTGTSGRPEGVPVDAIHIKRSGQSGWIPPSEFNPATDQRIP